MKLRARQNTESPVGWLIRRGLHGGSVFRPAIFAVCISMSMWASGQLSDAHFMPQQRGGGQQAAPAPHPPSGPQVYTPPPQHFQQVPPPQHFQQTPPSSLPHFVQPASPSRSLPEVRAYTPPHTYNQSTHPGQQHLPEWLNSHENLTPKQQEDALRSEPGFRDLPADQQQRLVNRLHALDEKTPEQRQRILQRNENFERLSPERRQEVRGASQALGQMPPDRQQAVRRAFRELRGIPPQQRQQMLNSGTYVSQFSPQERTVLGNLLSIEPYQVHPGAVPQPYFGR